MNPVIKKHDKNPGPFFFFWLNLVQVSLQLIDAVVIKNIILIKFE